jgi:hypothetical protein
MPGPIWKSLCQPAILPLTTDYLPSREVLEKNYTESFYTLTLPDSDDPIAKHYSCDMDLLEELICQRIAQVCSTTTIDILIVSYCSTTNHVASCYCILDITVLIVQISSQ